MNEPLFTRNKGLLWLSLGIITLVTFFPLMQSGFAGSDDLLTYIVSKRGGVYMNAKYLAYFAGRFYYFFIHPIYSVPYLADTPILIKLFHHVPLVLGVVLADMIIYRITRSMELAFLFYLVFMVTAQASRHTSLFLNYPFFFTFSFDLLLISFIFLMRYFEHPRTYFMVLSVLLFTLGLLFSESYLVYLLVVAIGIFAISYRESREVKPALRRSFLVFLPFLCVGVLYVAAYLGFRAAHPSNYPGTMMDSSQLTVAHFFRVLWSVSITSFPMTVFQENRTLFGEKSELIGGYVPVILNIILTARIEWLIKGACVAVTAVIVLWTIPGFGYKTLLAGSGIAILLIFLPHVPLAVTVKYIEHVVSGHMTGYVTTYLSLFGTVLLITLVCAYLVSLLNFNRIVKAVGISALTLLFFTCSVLTDFGNYTVAKDTRSANLRLYAMDELMKTDAFLSLPPGSTLLFDHFRPFVSHSAPGLILNNFDWSSYISSKVHIQYNTYNTFMEIPADSTGEAKPLFYLTMRQAYKSEEIMLILARIRPRGIHDTVPDRYTDKAWVLYYSPYKTFSASFRVRNDGLNANVPMKVNHIQREILPGENIEMTIYNTQRNQPATLFSITAPSIDLESILVSDIVNDGRMVFYL
jgi:hypothetical protein